MTTTMLNRRPMGPRKATSDQADDSKIKKAGSWLRVGPGVVCGVDGPNTIIPPAEAEAAAAASKTRSLSQKAPLARQVDEPNTTIPPAETEAEAAAAAAAAVASCQSEEGNGVLPTAKVRTAAQTAAPGTQEVHVVPVTPLAPTAAATPIAHVATSASASTATLSCGGEAGNTVLPTAAVTQGDIGADSPPSDIFENESEYKVHVDVMKRREHSWRLQCSST
eukprot:jgi/Psemu1/38154/gm1.38154_g